jgi:hypothetical protein
MEDKEEEEPPKRIMEEPQEEVTAEAGPAKAGPTSYSRTEHRL